MPGKVPAGDETVLYALPEDQPDSLSEGETSKQADVDLEHGMTVVKEEDPVVTNGSEDSAPEPAAEPAPADDEPAEKPSRRFRK